MTTWPAYVPTLEDDSPEASSATANASAAPPPTSVARPSWAPSIESTPVLPVVLKIATAMQSIARLMTPAMPRPRPQSIRI